MKLRKAVKQYLVRGTVPERVERLTGGGQPRKVISQQWRNRPIPWGGGVDKNEETMRWTPRGKGCIPALHLGVPHFGGTAIKKRVSIKKSWGKQTNPHSHTILDADVGLKGNGEKDIISQLADVEDI